MVYYSFFIWNPFTGSQCCLICECVLYTIIFSWGLCNMKIFMLYLFCFLQKPPTLPSYNHVKRSQTNTKKRQYKTFSFFLLRRNRRSSLCCLDTKLTAAYSNNAEKTKSRQTAIQISIAFTYDTYQKEETISRNILKYNTINRMKNYYILGNFLSNWGINKETFSKVL